MVNLITTDSYFNVFNILVKLLRENGSGITRKNLVFCEEKVSLMAERLICYELKGSFNTDVYSFGNFLRVKKRFEKLLTKEGSAMAVKRILSGANLKSFKAGNINLAPTLYELIMQLKSAHILPNDILRASEKTEGVLKNKLSDIGVVFSEYEKFIKENGFEDQSSSLSYLPSVIDKDEDIPRSDVFIVGFGAFTAQMRVAIEKLIDKSSSVTAILVKGENPLVFVNETAEFIKGYCVKNRIPMIERNESSEYVKEAKEFIDNAFNPAVNRKQTADLTLTAENKKIFGYAALSPYDEITRVAEVIKSSVMKGECRYRDVTVALPDVGGYKDYIKSAFEILDIPYFLDERIKPTLNPLITLITAYTETYRKNFERKSLIAFIKNPLFERDKKLADAFENYIIRYNVNYYRIKDEFTFPTNSDFTLEEIENFRKKVAVFLGGFDVRKMLEALSVKDKLLELSNSLSELKEREEAAVNEQIFDAVGTVLDEIDMMLGLKNLTASEFKNVFLSGISALEMSIIPQYNDAVFVGGYKETALAKAKYLFAPALTADVPAVKADVALLSDSDIDALENIKLMVEPKIRVVNHRVREYTALALGAFSERLYLSYPVSAVDGKKNVKSEIYVEMEKLFSLSAFPEKDGYLTFNQGVKSFSLTCGQIQERDAHDFTVASSFYHASNNPFNDYILNRANKEAKTALSGPEKRLIDKETSPTAIEEYYKCPYRAFLSRSLKLNPREEGFVSVLSVGQLMHDIFKDYTLIIDKVSDRESSDRLFEQVSAEVLSRDEYKKFLGESTTKTTVKRVLIECKKYCFNTFLSLKNSKFKVKSTEVPFGDGKAYPAVNLLGGKFKIKGKIDRVDESDGYFRVVDYKTGGVDVTDKSLFAGIKLQLYLYAAAVQGKFIDGEKKPAGLYYLPVSDKYEKSEDKGKPLAQGKTLIDDDALNAQDVFFDEKGESEFIPASKDKNGKIKNAVEGSTISAYVDYAVKISELAAEQMNEGVIVNSPYEGECRYCQYKSLCDFSEVKERKLGKVEKDTIEQAVKGEE